MACMSTSQYEEITKLVSVDAALDPILFAGDVHNESAISKFEKSIEAAVALPPYNIHDLWCQENYCWVTFRINLFFDLFWELCVFPSDA